MSKYKKRALPVEYECARINKTAMLVFSGVFLFLAVFTRWVCGSPLPFLHLTEAARLIPPVFVMVLLLCCFYVLLGIALAAGLMSSGDAAHRYRGGMYFFIMLLLTYVWYPLFFCAKSVFFSMAVLLVCLLSGVISSFCFAKISRVAFFLMCVCNAFLVYLTYLNIAVFLTI